jgi:hypothetical protein
LRCALTEHRWESTPTIHGVVLVLCARCEERVLAGFVDQPEVLGLPAVAGRTAWLGDGAAGRLAVDLVQAMTHPDQGAWDAAREAATARPGASIDSLARLASALVLMPGNDAALRLFSAAHEVDLWALAEGQEGGTDEQR